MEPSEGADSAKLRLWLEALGIPQRIFPYLINIHRLEPTTISQYFADLTSYQRWREGGPNTVHDSLALLRPSIDRAAYIEPALAARAANARIIRIFLLPRGALEPNTWDWRRYLLEVQYAHFADAADEVLIMFPLEVFTEYFQPPLIDLMQVGEGVVITSYDSVGNPNARTFLGPGTPEAKTQREHIMTILALAIARGVILRQARWFT